MSFAIVTDSAANLTNEVIDRYDLQILSLLFRVGNKEFYSYIKGEDNDIEKFYTMMRNKETITTSQVNREDAYQMFDKLLGEGKDVLYIGFSSGLSGSYQAGYLAMEDLRQKHPQRKFFAVDTLAASLGEGLLVTYAAELRAAGKSIEEVRQWLLDNRLHLCHWFTVDDLFYLKRGGRISAATAIVGSMLHIKPVMHVDNAGKLVPVTKVRGRKNALDALVAAMVASAINPKDQLVYISHGDCLADAQYVANQINQKMHPKDILIHYVDPVIGAHSGPGTVALFFLGKER